MNNYRLQKIVIRIASILIILAIFIGLFMTLFQTKAVEKQISELEQNTNLPISEVED